MPKAGENWTCPYCGCAQVMSDSRFAVQVRPLDLRGWVEGQCGYRIEAIACANEDCKKLSMTFALHKAKLSPSGGGHILEQFHQWRLLPASYAKPQPHYVPEGLRRDYEEACAIRDLSPKASATLIRRCIQGIIRDFCGIVKGRLVDEIHELRKQVDAGNAPVGVQHDTVDAIDHVRKIGNIGAHMESDINLIVDVDPGEAQVLIGLAELLFDEWYTAREQRTARLKQLGMIAAAKKSNQQQQ